MHSTHLGFTGPSEAALGACVIVRPDLKILDASEAYLQSTLLWRNEIEGYDFFDVFPDNPFHEDASGVANLRASFQEVLRAGMPHAMAIQRYDVRDFVAPAETGSRSIGFR